MKSLGIFITSDRYPDYLIPLAQAAHSQGLKVLIHFSGSGARLVQHADLDALAAMADISVCKHSAADHGVKHLLSENKQISLADQDMAWLITVCDRHLFL